MFLLIPQVFAPGCVDHRVDVVVPILGDDRQQDFKTDHNIMFVPHDRSLKVSVIIPHRHSTPLHSLSTQLHLHTCPHSRHSFSATQSLLPLPTHSLTHHSISHTPIVQSIQALISNYHSIHDLVY